MRIPSWGASGRRRRIRQHAFSPPLGVRREKYLEETMSRAELERFVADVKADPRLQTDLKERGSGVASLVEIARSRGYEITTQDVRDYVRSQDRDITEEELDRVTAGGVFQGGFQGGFGGGFKA